MLWLVLVILLVVLLLAAVPAWPYSSGWGYSPAGVIAAIIAVILLLWLVGAIEFRDPDGRVDIDVTVEEGG
jgi:Protein of unknown function (DUF3309)